MWLCCLEVDYAAGVSPLVDGALPAHYLVFVGNAVDVQHVLLINIRWKVSVLITQGHAKLSSVRSDGFWGFLAFSHGTKALNV